ncbi:MAG: hypothetical protein LUI12_10760 [Clostridiales bacterium]|nr:hypothetical protein [Clostridiales bacterium]
MIREDKCRHRNTVNDDEMMEFLFRRADIREMVYQEMLEEKRRGPHQKLVYDHVSDLPADSAEAALEFYWTMFDQGTKIEFLHDSEFGTEQMRGEGLMKAQNAEQEKCKAGLECRGHFEIRKDKKGNDETVYVMSGEELEAVTDDYVNEFEKRFRETFTGKKEAVRK